MLHSALLITLGYCLGSIVEIISRNKVDDDYSDYEY